jgi:hypothetical protein
MTARFELPSVGERVGNLISDERNLTIFQQFLSTVEPLKIQETDLSGTIMVIGHGPAFPERSLVCTSESKFRKLRPSVKRLICCDSELFCSPKYHFDIPVSSTPDDLTKVHSRIISYPWAAGYAMEQWIPDNYIDTIFAFEIVELSGQLDRGLMTQIARVLKPGGNFIGSGCLHKEDYYNGLDSDKAQPMRVIQQENLGNPSDMGYPFQNAHRGVIIQKE